MSKETSGKFPFDNMPYYKHIEETMGDSLPWKLNFNMSDLAARIAYFESIMDTTKIPDDIETCEDLEAHLLKGLGMDEYSAWCALVDHLADVYIYSRAYMHRVGIREEDVRAEIHKRIWKPWR